MTNTVPPAIQPDPLIEQVLVGGWEHGIIQTVNSTLFLTFNVHAGDFRLYNKWLFLAIQIKMQFKLIICSKNRAHTKAAAAATAGLLQTD